MTVTPFDIAAIERATLDAVAPQQIDDSLPCWLLPFERTTVGRAKSAVPLQHQGLLPGDIAHIEERYRNQHLEPAWRMANTPGLQALLDPLMQRGYSPHQPTLVQTATTAQLATSSTPHAVILSHTPDATWRSVYTAPGFDPVDGQARIEALSRSPVVMYATVLQDGQACAAGTASFSRGWMGVHGMRTIPTHRHQGMAQAILSALACEGLRRGIPEVFLQVEEGNRSALSLYERLGFCTAWTYHYWRK
jgi:GNAT superfamily N-acetyltransferase